MGLDSLGFVIFVHKNIFVNKKHRQMCEIVYNWPTMKSESSALPMNFPLRTAARLTGLSPDLLRAWEKRYGVVVPMRTPGGTRRYTAADLERLKLVKAAVDAGHRISEVARFDDQTLRERARTTSVTPAAPLEEIIETLHRLDAAEAQRLISLQLSALGPARFARDFAMPLVKEIGELWASERMGIASEHLATSVLGSMLGSALRPTTISLLGPVILFATPPGERHELGLQMAALTALGAGANPLYLGAELPVPDLLGAAAASGCAAVALGLVTLPSEDAEQALSEIRGGLPGAIQLWVGGYGASNVDLLDGVESMASLEELEQRIALLGLEYRRG
jgi:DNA-binding transcriptional MerR regulator